MGFFSDLAKSFFDEIKETTKKNATLVSKETDILSSEEQKYASTYLDPFSLAMSNKLLSAMGAGSGEEGVSEESVGSSNSELFGAKEYKGPDQTATRNPWNGGVGPFTSGIKQKISNVDKYDDMILKHAKTNNMDPMLCKIMIVMESGGRADAISSDGHGSIGLTQITPGNVGIAVDASKLRDPDYNIEMTYKIMESKAGMLKSMNMATTVQNISYAWNGIATNGKIYSNAFKEIYEGFGLSANNDYKKLSGVKEASKSKSSVASDMSGARKDADKLIAEAKKYLGSPYIWGGKTPSPGFDCSGYVGWVFKEALGKNITTWTVTQESAGSMMSVGEAKAGDLYFWGAKGGSTHVALATGGGNYLHAPKPGDVIQEGKVSYWAPDFAVKVS